MLSRRQFLTLSGGAAAAGAAAWAGLIRGADGGVRSATPAGNNDHVLVVVQLTGGNDALNTVVPHDGRYHDLRPTLAIADDQLVALQGEPAVGLHPALQPLTQLWDAGHLAVLPLVGFAADSRSHFESLASWWTASPEHRTTDGWLGRWLGAADIADDDPLVAIALGGGAVPALRAAHTTSTAVNDLASFRLAAPRPLDGAPLEAAFAASAAPVAGDPLLAQAQSAIASTRRAVDVLSTATTTNAVDDQSLTALLATTATLITMDLGTRVFVVSASGFDTHADQLDTHARLLGDLATGVSSFFATLTTNGYADRVLLVTTSEFGRRAAQNGSGGTDHGHGGVHFVAGPKVRGGLYGAIDLGALVDGDLPAAVDARGLYAAALDWLGGPSSALLDGHTDPFGLLAA